MPRFRAIAEFIDVTTGRRVHPGEFAELVDEGQINRLRRAGCIGEPEDPATIKAPVKAPAAVSADAADTMPEMTGAAETTGAAGAAGSKRKHSRKRESE